MATPKTMLCRCEDITLDECEDAISEGYACFEDLKRFLGVGTGPCQGKSCVQAAMHLVARARGIDPSEVDVMTFRPPVRPIPFETLAAETRPIDPPVRAETGRVADGRAPQHTSDGPDRDHDAAGQGPVEPPGQPAPSSKRPEAADADVSTREAA